MGTQDRHHATLEAIYLAHKDHVFNYVYRLCGDQDVAEDIVQQVFLKLINDPNLASLTHPKAYLFTVARNTLYDSWKKKREVRLDEHEEERYADMSMESGEDPGEQVAESQLRDRIDRYLMSMPEKSRELMVLRYVEDLSVKEIAHITSRTVSNVKVGLHRARHRFDAGFTRHMYASVAASREQCDELGRLVAPWGEGDIPLAQMQAIEAHIDACRVCSDDASDMKQMRKLFATLPLVGVPLALDATLREAVAAEVASQAGAAATGAGAAAGGTGGTGAASGSATSAASAAGSKAAMGMGAKVAAGVVAVALVGGGGAWLASRPAQPLAVTPPTAAEPDPGVTPAPDSFPGVSVTATARLKPGGPPVTRNLAWQVHRLDPAGGAQFVTSASTAKPRFALPPGTYRVTVRDGQARASRQIEVSDAQPVNIDLVLGSGFLRVAARLAPGQAPTRESVRFEVDEGDPDINGKYPFVAYANPREALSLPTGHYRLEASLGLNARYTTEFDVLAGETTRLEDIVLNAGYLNLAARLRPDLPPLRDNKVRLEITEPEPDVTGAYTFIGYAPQGRNVILRAGRYRIVAQWGLNTRTVTEVEVAAGQRTVRDDIILPGGYLKLGARLRPGAPPLRDKLRLEVYGPEPDVNGKYPFIGYAQPNQPLRLAAGRYRVAAHFGLNAGTATEVTVRAGEVTTNEDIIVDGGYLRVRATHKGKPLKGAGLRLEVYDTELDIRGKRQFITYAQPGGPGVGLARGTYYVKATWQGQSVSDNVEVRAGDSVTLDLAFGS